MFLFSLLLRLLPCKRETYHFNSVKHFFFFVKHFSWNILSIKLKVLVIHIVLAYLLSWLNLEEVMQRSKIPFCFRFAFSFSFSLSFFFFLIAKTKISAFRRFFVVVCVIIRLSYYLRLNVVKTRFSLNIILYNII